MSDAIFHVRYTTHAGAAAEVYVRVCETQAWGGVAYYATDMGVQLALYPANPHPLGCGKNDMDPIGAVHRLVQDHGTVLAIRGV